MSNYSDNPGMCRADFFQPSGKWYATEEIDMSKLYSGVLIHDAVKQAVDAAAGSHYQGMTVVVLEPYHEHSHPISYVR